MLVILYLLVVEPEKAEHVICDPEGRQNLWNPFSRG